MATKPVEALLITMGRRKQIARSILGAATFCIAATPIPVFAQTGPYVNTTSAAIGSSTRCNNDNQKLRRTIAVSDSFLVSDLDVGFIASHTYRTDIQLEVQSPSGTRVTLLTGPVNQNLDDYNVQLNDESSTLVNTGTHASNDNTGVAPYENDVGPENSLSAFDGENAQGTWTVFICDNDRSLDDGTFLRAELLFTEETDADLSLTLGVSNTTPTIGSQVTYTVAIANAGPVSADSVQAEIDLPSGLSYNSDTSGGFYNSGTGVWSVPGTIASGGSTSFQITATVQSSGSYSTLAEVIASAQTDPDSTPNNSASAPLEDDTDSVTLAPGGTPGVPPTLTCTAGSDTHDWDTNNWPSGSFAQSYSGGSVALDFTITGDTGGFQGTSPETNTNTTGGLSPAQQSLYLFVDQSTSSDSVDISFDIGTIGIGVDGMQFSIFDVDLFGGQFTDEISIVGFLNGSPVVPILTNSVANTASGFTAVGTATANNATSDGNVVVTFTSSVDSVQITYGSGPTAPAFPGVQAITLHDITYCTASPNLSASKSVSVYDPNADGLFAIPDNDVVYTITTTNTGPGAVDTDSIFIVDILPIELEFFNGDVDGTGPATGPVAFSQSGAGLTFDVATDVRFAPAGPPPASFAACNLPVDPGYDPDIRYVCFNPKGAMAAGSPNSSFSLTFRARIK